MRAWAVGLAVALIAVAGCGSETASNEEAGFTRADWHREFRFCMDYGGGVTPSNADVPTCYRFIDNLRALIEEEDASHNPDDYDADCLIALARESIINYEDRVIEDPEDCRK